MSEQKAERRVKVLCRVNCYVENASGGTQKINADSVTLMSSAEIKHFGRSVTKDVPDDQEEVERA